MLALELGEKREETEEREMLRERKLRFLTLGIIYVWQYIIVEGLEMMGEGRLLN